MMATPLFLPPLLTSCPQRAQCVMTETERYFRLEGACVPCPQNVVATLVCLILVVFVVAMVGRYMSKKNINVGITSIAIDYLQVKGGHSFHY
jgi:hypothetical protein